MHLISVASDFFLQVSLSTDRVTRGIKAALDVPSALVLSAYL